MKICFLPYRQKNGKSGHHGFTLVEMMVVIGIIALLAALLMPALKRSLEFAQQVKCSNKMRQLHTASMMYLNDWKGNFWTFGYFCRPISSEYTNAIPGKRQDGAWVSGNAPDSLYFCQSNCNPKAAILSNYSYNGYLLSYNPYHSHIMERYFKRLNAIKHPNQTSLFSELNTFHPTKTPFYFRWDSKINTGLYETDYLRSPHIQQSTSNVIFVDGHSESIQGTITNKQMGRADRPIQNW